MSGRVVVLQTLEHDAFLFYLEGRIDTYRLALVVPCIEFFGMVECLGRVYLQVVQRQFRCELRGFLVQKEACAVNAWVIERGEVVIYGSFLCHLILLHSVF